MSLFGQSSMSYIGVDIGSSSIKMVELKKVQNKVALVSYGFSDKLAPNFTDVNRLDIKATTSIIENIVRKANFSTSKNVISSLPTFTVFSSVINVSSKLTDKDLDSSIIWEAKKVIPLPLQDIVLDWQKINEPIKPATAKAAMPVVAAPTSTSTSTPSITPPTPSLATGQKILLIGAPKNLIKSYAYAFKSMNYNLVGLETEIFGLIRSLLGNDKSTVMIVQMGANSTNLFVVAQGVPVLSRSIDVGGLAVSKAIAKNLEMDLEKAEQFKFDQVETGEDKLPKVVTDTLNPVFNEIKYIREVYNRKETQEIQKVVLTGGSSMLAGLREHVANMMDMNVVLGDPWFRVSYPVELKPVLEQIGPRMAVAIGLAMREYDKE